MDTALEQFHAWATSNGISPEPTKTQLLLSASPRRLLPIAEAACVMAGATITPAATIRILGVLLDPQLTWEAHSIATATKARNAVHAVRRAARFLPREDRALLMEAMALPYVDYAQTALSQPSKRAQGHLRRAYNRAARVAACKWRTRPALFQLRWASFARRRAAQRASGVAALWHRPMPWQTGLLPGSPGDVLTSRRSRYLPRPVLSAFGAKMLSHWGPAVLSQISDNTVFDGIPEQPERPPTPKQTGQPPPPPVPSDEYTAQRRAFQAEAVASFGMYHEISLPCKHQPVLSTSALAYSPDTAKPKRQAQTSHPLRPEDVYAACKQCTAFRGLVPCPDATSKGYGRRVFVWGDGSAYGGKAGYGVYYGSGNLRNTAARCKGPQTNNRAELAAFLHCILSDPRPLLYITDSRYVQEGVALWREKWRAGAWFRRPLRAEYILHAD
eukprot:gene1089-6108_t